MCLLVDMGEFTLILEEFDINTTLNLEPLILDWRLHSRRVRGALRIRER